MAELQYDPLPDFVLTESNLSKFVSEHYGRPWRLQQQGDCLANDSYIELNLEPEDIESDRPEAEATISTWLSLPWPLYPWKEDWFNRIEIERHDDAPELDEVMWDLGRKGLVKPGSYLIKVWW